MSFSQERRSTTAQGDLNAMNRIILAKRSQSHRMKNHECELFTALDQKKTNLSICEKIKARLLRSILVSGSTLKCKMYLRSSAAVNMEEERQLSSKYWWVIHPFSQVRAIWQVIMCIVLFVFLFYVPFSLAFFDIGEIENCGISCSIMMAFDCILIADIIMHFVTGIVLKVNKEIILNPGGIARHYVRGYFVMDMLSSLPFENLILLGIKPQFVANHFTFLQIISGLSVLKMLRVRSFLDYFLAIIENLRPSTVHLLHLSVIYLIAVHWTACLHYLVPLLVHGDDLVSNKAPKSWVVVSGLINSTIWAKYQRSLFRAESNILRTGFGAVYPDTTEDIVVSLVSLFVGTVLNAYVFGVIMYYMMSFSATETKYQESMIQLQEYMRYKKLPLSTQKRILKYQANKFQKGYFREMAIMATLSEALREEINMYCCRRLVLDVSFFHGVSLSIIKNIVNKLHPEVCMPNDVIMKAGTSGDCMFFLSYGTACVVTPTGKEVCHLEDGAHFGEIALIDVEERRIASVIAIDICQLYRLDRVDFLSCISTQPELYAKMQKIAKRRMDETQAMEDEHKKKLVERANRL